MSESSESANIQISQATQMWVLLVFTASHCSHTIRAGMGVQSYNFSLAPEEIVCVNATAYPFAIVFGSFNDDTIYREYHHHPSSPDNTTHFETLMRFLSVFRAMMDPEHSVAIIAKSETYLTFLTVELPSMCRDGIFFSNAENINLAFGPNESGFFNLDTFSDKCIVFGPMSNITVHVRILSDNPDDQVFVHHSFTEFESFGGNESFSGVFDVGEDPFFRIVATERVEFDLEVDADVRHIDSAIFIPSRPAQICPAPRRWYNETVAAVAVGVTSFLGVLLIFVTCVLSIRHRGGQRTARRGRIRSGDTSDSRSLASMSLFE